MGTIIRGYRTASQGSFFTVPPGPVFDPLTLITGFGGFWRANAGVTLSGSNVTTWADQSAQGNNYTCPGNFASIQPTFSSTGFNTSFNGITFASTAGGTFATSYASTTLSFFVMGSFTTSAGGLTRIFANSSPGGNDFTAPQWDLENDAGNTIRISTSGVQGNGGSSVTVSSGVPALFGGVFDGVNANIWVNGAVVGSGTAFSSTLGAAGPNFQGLGKNGGGDTVSMTLAFVGLTSKVMSSTDWTNLKSYSNSTWGTSF